MDGREVLFTWMDMNEWGGVDEVDNSEYMRYHPTRFEAQADAVQVTNVVFKTKIDLNAESTVGIMTMTGKGYALWIA